MERIEIPDVLRNHARSVGAEEWLRDLPALIDHLRQEWGIEVGRPLGGATEAYVAEAYLSGAYASETDASETGVAEETAAGETAVPRLPAVLKLMVPLGDRARHEITALRLADGHGCATLYREDAALGAVLVERLGPPLFDLGLPLVRRHEILCDTAARLWRPAAGHGLPTGADRAREVAGYVTDTWTELDRPCSEAAIEDAVRCAERRAAAHDDERAVLVHGDVHQLNALRSGTGFKLVDPDGLLAEPECDLGTVMRGDPVELLRGDPYERARRLAARTGLDVTAVWEWGVLERVASGLHCTKIDLQPLGRDTLAAADAVATGRP